MLTSLLLSVLPCPLPQCPLSTGMANSYFTKLTTLALLHLPIALAILMLTQHAMSVSQPLVCLSHSEVTLEHQSVLIISSESR